MSLYEGIKTAIIYGAGKGGALTYEHLTKHGIEVVAFIDDFKTGEYFGKPIIKLEDIKNYNVDAYFIGTAHSLNRIFEWANNIFNIENNAPVYFSLLVPLPDDYPFFACAPPLSAIFYLNLFEKNSFIEDFEIFYNFSIFYPNNSNTYFNRISKNDIDKYNHIYNTLSEKLIFIAPFLVESQKAVQVIILPKLLSGGTNMIIVKFYNMILSSIQGFMTYFGDNGKKSKAGRKPKLTDEEIASLFVLSFITGMPVTKLAKQMIDKSIASYHIFRKSRIKRVYKILRRYLQMRVLLIVIRVLITKTRLRLIIDGTILPVANVNRARTQRIKRFKGKMFWVKRNRNLYSEHYKQKISFEELYYGVLVMVLCDTNGAVYDIWFHPASYHEIKSFRLRAKTSLWFKKLINLFEVIGDKGYKGCENVVVCIKKEDKAQRQIVETIFSRIKQFNAISRWRKGITLLAYLYAYAIGFSFFRTSEVESCG